MSAKALVDEQVKSLATICELDSDVMQAFHGALLTVAERHLASMTPASTSSGEKIALTKKGTAKRASKPKEDKLSSKNAYHFFVAAKMGEVKAAGVEAKGRMKRIGEMWKALVDEDRQPFKDMASRYNEYVQNEMKSADWKDRREAIVAAANQSATAGVASSSTVVADDAGEEEGDEEADVDETSTVVTTATATVATVASVPAPVVQAPAPVQATAPVKRTAGPKKK
jgi:hypothetical protein